MPQPPEEENKPLVWPYWPIKLRTSSSHEEGCDRDWSVATKEFIGENGKVKKLKAVRVEWKDGKMIEVPGSEFEMPADLVLLAMGFLGPVQSGLLEQFGVEKDARSNVKADTEGQKAYATSVPRCSPPATCAAASRWWSGRFAKAASARAPWTNF